MAHNHLTIVLTVLFLALVGAPRLHAEATEPCTTPEPTPEQMESLFYYGNNAVLSELVEELEVVTSAQATRTHGASAAEPGVGYRIPIQFWIYRDGNGTLGPDLQDLQVWVDGLNRLHRDNGSPIRFYQKCGVNFIDDDDHLLVRDVEGFFLTAGATGRKAKGAVNVHAVRDVSNSGGVYNLLTDSILVEWPDLVNAVSELGVSSLTHEVGHYLGLNHTHHRADSLPPHACFREPVSRTVTFSRLNLCLRPRGARCESTGDALCDTAADPNLSDHRPDDFCVYADDVTDYRGDVYSPDSRNIMSYSRRICRNNFSAGQVGVMLGSLLFDPRRPAEWLANPRNAFDRFEPDGLRDTARPIALGETQQRSFHWDFLGIQSGDKVFQRCDQDWVVFRLTERMPVEIVTSELAGQPKPNTILTLFDETGNQLATNDDDPPRGGFSRLDASLDAGTYALLVTSKSDFPHPDSHGHYQLTVRRCTDCCFNGALDGLSTLSGTSFNLGARAAAWTDFVPDDLVVETATFSFNSAQPLHFGGQGAPVTSSVLVAHLCNGADLTFRNGGRLEVGDSGSGRRADVRVGAGSVLTLEGGSLGAIHAESRLIVEAGGRLVLDGASLAVQPKGRIVVQAGGTLEVKAEGDLAVFHPGRVTVMPGGRFLYQRQARIRLEGDEAVLDLRGDLEIGSGSLFTFGYTGKSSGYVRFQPPAVSCAGDGYLACPNVQVNGPAQMLFIGTAPQDKILEIAAPLRPDSGLLRLLVRRGRVELAPEGEIQIADAWLVAGEAEFVGSGGSALALDGGFRFIGGDLLFEGVGIRARGDGVSGRRLTIGNSEFRNASVPIFTEGLGVRLERVRISGHELGWLGAGLVGTSEISRSRIDGGGQGATGIDLFGGNDATVRVVRSEITGHRIAGVLVEGDIEVAVRCGSVRENRRGFFVRDGASLDMSTLSGNGNVDASDNVVTIELNEAEDLSLDAGHNLLAPKVAELEKWPSRVIEGTIRGPSCADAKLQASGNTWNQGVAFPGPGIVPGNIDLRSARPACAALAMEVVDTQPAGPGACVDEPQADLCLLLPNLCSPPLH